MGPTRTARGLANSSSSSGISFQGDGQSQAVGYSRPSSSFGNSSNSIQGVGRSHNSPVSGDASNTFLNSVASPGPSAGVSSLVTDANSGLSGGPNLRRSSSFNTESYMRIPASPMSFSSNNVSISGSSVMDGSCVVQQNSNQDTNSQQVSRSQQQQHQGASGATSLPTSRMGQVSFPTGSRVRGAFTQDPDMSHLQKKPRLDIKQEDIMHQQVIQQALHRQDSLQLQTHNPELQALIQQHRLRQQQQQFLQSIPPVQRAHLLQQQQFRQQLQQQGMQPVSSGERPYDNGVCSRRLMQYLYHQRQRPPDNSIAYWRKFVSEYYSPRAKKRWCLSLYDNVGHPSFGVFPQATKGAWQCDICGSKSGRGFEATFEVLPRLNEIKFGSGVIDELLFLDLPQEVRSTSGLMMLEYGRAVQETVYEQLRVVREGHLRVIFTRDLKILSWEFCVRRHEELLPRRLVAPQVNQLLQVAQKCLSTIAEKGSDGISHLDLQTNSNKVVTAGRQLARSLESHSLNDLGFSKRYVRCLQISEVVHSMKDLMDFCRDHKVGPMEGLKNYPRHSNAAKLQMQNMHDMEQLATIQGLPTDRSAINKLTTQHPGLNSHMSNNNQTVHRGVLSGTAQAAFAISNFQNLLTRQNSMNSNSSSLQHEASSSFSFNNSSQNPSSPFQGPSLHQRSFNGYDMHQQSHLQPHQGGQTIQQQMMQQLLQNMNNNNNNGGGMQNVTSGGISCGSNPSSGVTSAAGSGGGPTPSGCNSLKAASNSDSSAAGGNNGFNQKAPDLPQNIPLSDEEIDGFFNSDFDDTMGFNWNE
ncbi:probable transcriptional regulator SLK2 [Rhododendron vialii]|uniref:probable transcriptional regulator SLK2 n=1 Tax=Rhododendron vialii TaxID=182163 RepID=UPI00265EE82A|nr:probable transcriptional regulator SLK2 [Rhododendron vialii]